MGYTWKTLRLQLHVRAGGKLLLKQWTRENFSLTSPTYTITLDLSPVHSNWNNHLL